MDCIFVYFVEWCKWKRTEMGGKDNWRIRPRWLSKVILYLASVLI